jgi:putrescine transport system permease protein
MSAWFHQRGWRQVIIGAPYVWLTLLFLLPFFIVIAMSFARQASSSPPFAFPPEWPHLFYGNYEKLVSRPIYLRAFLNSVWIAALSAFFCLLIGYPMALAIARAGRTARNVLLMAVILPFWTSFLLRVYAWTGMLGTNSWFNKGLTSMINTLTPWNGDINNLPMMNSTFAVILVMVYSYLPFMILPLYANLEKLDRSLDEAAMDLGARPFRVFLDVTLPLSVPGIIAGGLLVFIPASGELVIPTLVGNSSAPMIGQVINDEFAQSRNWPMAATVAVALLFVLVLPMIAYQHFQARADEGEA